MRIVAVSMVKDELDVIPYVLDLLVKQVDAIIIADNMSTDGTREFLHNYARTAPIPIAVRHDEEPGYMQSDKMTALAHLAHSEYGADWIIPFDADEVWTAGSKPIRTILEDRRPDEYIVHARLYDHMATGEDNLEDPNPIRRMPWRRPSPAPLHKVCVRWDPSLVIGMGNHEAFYDNPVSRTAPILEIHHFPYRSAEQILRKTVNGAAAYKAADLPEYYGVHWRQWGQLIEDHGEDVMADVFYTYYWRAVPDEPLKIDGERHSPLYRNPVWPTSM